MNKIEQYRFIELDFACTAPAFATFCHEDKMQKVQGFQCGNSMRIRFMPKETGTWTYLAECGEEKREGTFECVATKKGNHGPVRTEGYHFRYADETPFVPFGTTCYTWTYQSEEIKELTLKTLKSSPFNKVRMFVFPKYMEFNHGEPSAFPFRKNDSGSWDISAPDENFWVNFESCIQKLDALNIEAEIILFHPYDKWGFSNLPKQECLNYITYCVRRLSAFKNVWWSIANEYDLVPDRTAEDWEDFGRKIKEEDIYGHPVSIHDFCALFPKSDWMTHVSVQSNYPSRVILWRSEYRLPVIVDEMGYEGDLPFAWGSLSAKEYVFRMWSAVLGGGYCTHGETFYRKDEIIWWAKGGELKGKTIPRIAFLKNLLLELGTLEPMCGEAAFDAAAQVEGQYTAFGRAVQLLSEPEQKQTIADMLPVALQNQTCRLYWFGNRCSAWQEITPPTEGKYSVELIDSWNMTRNKITTTDKTCRIELPSREGMAVLITKIKDKE